MTNKFVLALSLFYLHDKTVSSPAPHKRRCTYRASVIYLIVNKLLSLSLANVTASMKFFKGKEVDLEKLKNSPGKASCFHRQMQFREPSWEAITSSTKILAPNNKDYQLTPMQICTSVIANVRTSGNLQGSSRICNSIAKIEHLNSQQHITQQSRGRYCTPFKRASIC